MEVLIIGAGIGGLTLGLMLHRAGIACRIFEAAPELKAVGVGINILPHASRELCALGLEDALAKVAMTTREYCFYNRFGQFIYSEPAGRFAGYDVPQFSVHRGDLQMVLLEAFIARAGADKVMTGWRCTRVEHEGPEAIAHFEDINGKPLPSQAAAWSSVRKVFTLSCANSFSRTKGRPNIPGSTCGAASRAGSHSCRARA
jgi:2-polyprenyl-6-methoxyphenol hydroxylase-like FAD-dependent oxidoreductase